MQLRTAKALNCTRALSMTAALLLSSMMLSAPASAADWYVDTAGNDSNLCTTPGVGNACLTLAAAITKASALDTVWVNQGTYVAAGTISVTKTLTLKGWQNTFDARTRVGAETILQFSGGLHIAADNVVIDGFTVENSTGGMSGGIGIYVGNPTTGTIVVNNIIQNNVIGLTPANTGGTQVLVQHNLIKNNNQPGPASGAGIYSDQYTAGGTLSNVLIDANRFEGNLDAGIDFSSSDAAKPQSGITISNNTFSGNSRALFAINLVTSTFTGNDLLNATEPLTADLRLGEGVSALTITNNHLTGGLGRVMKFSDFGTGSPVATGVSFNYNTIGAYTGPADAVLIEAASYTGPLGATCNSWNGTAGPTIASNPGSTGTGLGDAGLQAAFVPWLVNATDGSGAQPGYQSPSVFAVTPAGAPSAADNNFRRLSNAIGCAIPTQTVSLSGTFDWTEANASASWALGSDNLLGGIDDYEILVPKNLDDVTLTAPSLGAAIIQGPGDLPLVNLESVLVFDRSSDPGTNKNWTISNLDIRDFDLSIGFFSGPVGGFDDATITNNHILIATDLNAIAAPADVNQNIGIHFAFGQNQTISNNTIEIAGDGVSSGTSFATNVGMQSNTSGGNAYDNLVITGNTIRVLNAQSAFPQKIFGIWENAHGHSSNISVSNNDFVNLGLGNDSTLNLQRAFRVTSHSSLTTTVTYSGNTVDGANIGFAWLGSPEYPGTDFTGNQPVWLSLNTITNSATGVLVQSNGLADLQMNTLKDNGTSVDVVSGSQATLGCNGLFTSAIGLRVAGTGPVVATSNSIVGNTMGVADSGGPMDAKANWWGCPLGPPNLGCDPISGAVDASLQLASAPTCVSCSTNAHCSDGLNCNGAETCNLGTCSAGTPLLPNQCENAGCTEPGTFPFKPITATCNSGLDVCTVPDNCDGAGACPNNGGGGDTDIPPDLVCQLDDNCPLVSNPGSPQSDIDDDGLGDICDANSTPGSLVLSRVKLRIAPRLTKATGLIQVSGVVNTKDTPNLAVPPPGAPPSFQVAALANAITLRITDSATYNVLVPLTNCTVVGPRGTLRCRSTDRKISASFQARRFPGGVAPTPYLGEFSYAMTLAVSGLSQGTTGATVPVGPVQVEVKQGPTVTRTDTIGEFSPCSASVAALVCR